MSRATARRPLLADELLSLQASGALHVSLLTAARVLGCGEAQARRMAEAGALPVRAFKVGRAWRFVLADLVELLISPTAATAGAHTPAAALTDPDPRSHPRADVNAQHAPSISLRLASG